MLACGILSFYSLIFCFHGLDIFDFQLHLSVVDMHEKEKAARLDSLFVVK